MEKKCATHRCKRKAVKGKRFCPTCRYRKYKELRPAFYAYCNLRNNAKRRGKEFALTLPEFEEFCKVTEYLAKRGRSGGMATIDRIDPDKGYFLENLQVISNSDNVRKHWVDYWAAYYGKNPDDYNEYQRFREQQDALIKSLETPEENSDIVNEDNEIPF